MNVIGGQAAENDVDERLDETLEESVLVPDQPDVFVEPLDGGCCRHHATALSKDDNQNPGADMYTSHLDLSDHVRKASIRELQARLSDALDLEAQMKQAHWNVKGRDFIQLHELFDKVHGVVETFVDTIAERITTLGGIADGRVQTTAKCSGLYEYSLETSNGEQHLRVVAAVLGQFGKSVRADIDAAARVSDADTADLFTEISRETDKQLWFIEAHLM